MHQRLNAQRSGSKQCCAQLRKPAVEDHEFVCAESGQMVFDRKVCYSRALHIVAQQLLMSEKIRGRFAQMGDYRSEHGQTDFRAIESICSELRYRSKRGF